MKKFQLILWIISALVFGCHQKTQNAEGNIDTENSSIANAFIDAFYSFDPEKLESILPAAPESRASILYYQKWAECGNYEVLKRNDLIHMNDSIIKCPVTVKDDLIGALELDFNATDTFHLVISDGSIRSVSTSSNDPEMYFEAKEWVRINRSELIKKSCEGEDGPSPCECVKAMIKGFSEFKTQNSQP